MYKERLNYIYTRFLNICCRLLFYNPEKVIRPSISGKVTLSSSGNLRRFHVLQFLGRSHVLYFWEADTVERNAGKVSPTLRS